MFEPDEAEAWSERQAAKKRAKAATTDAPARYDLHIELKGETPEQLWRSLLDLVDYAIECEHVQGHWPHMARTDAGKISVVNRKS